MFSCFLNEHFLNPRANELKSGPRIRPKGFILFGAGWKNWGRIEGRIEESFGRPSIRPQVQYKAGLKQTLGLEQIVIN